MAKLHMLWLALEAIPSAEAVIAEWQFRLSENFESARTLLRPTDKEAGCYPAPAGQGVPCRLVKHGPDDFAAIPSDGGEAIDLKLRDVLVYRLDHRKLASEIATAFDFTPVFEVVNGIPSTWRIGTFQPIAGFAFPVFLTIPLESIDLQRTVESVSSQVDEPFIVLAPTGDQMRLACESLLKRRKACFLALSEAIESDGQGKWNASAAARHKLSVFQQETIPQATDVSTMVFFPTPANATWNDVRMTFIDGETVSIKVGGASGTFVYSQMGMADGRNAKPTKQWELLRIFAQGYGAVTWESPGAGRKNQSRRDGLVRNLKAFFRIDGEPIEYVEQTKGWRTVFVIEPDA